MKTEHSTFLLARHTVHRIDFDPATFTEADLFWLPHHTQLHCAGKKRKAEHLAGRLAAFYALQAQGLREIPAIGDNRQPLWPTGWFGSITHCGTTALAVVARTPVGLDREAIFTPEGCREMAESFVTPQECVALKSSALPFPLALTLAFSAKESAYKTFSFTTNALPGFASAAILRLNPSQVTLQFSAAFCPALAGKIVHLDWQHDAHDVSTLLTETLETT